MTAITLISLVHLLGASPPVLSSRRREPSFLCRRFLPYSDYGTSSANDGCLPPLLLYASICRPPHPASPRSYRALTHSSASSSNCSISMIPALTPCPSSYTRTWSAPRSCSTTPSACASSTGRTSSDYCPSATCLPPQLHRHRDQQCQIPPIYCPPPPLAPLLPLPQIDCHIFPLPHLCRTLRSTPIEVVIAYSAPSSCPSSCNRSLELYGSGAAAAAYPALW